MNVEKTQETAQAEASDKLAKNNTKSRKELTKEEADFYKLIRLRATATGVGQPYIASAIFRLTPISAPGLQTMGVDKFWRCYIDFDYMMEKGVEYAAGVLAHEPWHLLRDHNKRAANVGADTPQYSFLWNIAGDLEINDDIMNLVPKDSCFPGKGQFADLPMNQIAEVYFAQVKKMADEANKDCQQCGKPKNDQQGQGENQQGDGQQGGSGDQNDNGSGQGDQQGQVGSESGDANGHGQSGETCSCPHEGQGNGSGQGQQGQGGLPNPNCGSGSGNEIKEYELAEDDAEAVDADEHESIKKQIAEEIRRQEMSNPGSTPGNAKLWADEVLAHKPVSWKQVLRGQVKAAVAYKRGHTDYVRKRPARRQPIKDVVMPALRSPSPRIGLAIDTSGSNLHKLGVVLDEISRMTKQVGVRGNDLLAFAVDTRKSGKIQKVTDPKKIDLSGGGGTDMRVAYTELAKLSPKVDIGIILTDGETPWPTEAPSHNVKYITIVMVDLERPYSERIVQEAEDALGAWSKVVVVDVNEQ